MRRMRSLARIPARARGGSLPLEARGSSRRWPLEEGEGGRNEKESNGEEGESRERRDKWTNGIKNREMGRRA